MQRYHAANCTSAVNNSAISGSARDTSRAESSSVPSNYSLNSRYKSFFGSSIMLNSIQSMFLGQIYEKHVDALTEWNYFPWPFDMSTISNA